LSEAIERLVDEPLLAERLGKQGQQFVLVNFDDRESASIARREYDNCFAMATKENQVDDPHR
jgi:hypothetical protein